MEIVPNKAIAIESIDGAVYLYGGWVDSVHIFHDHRLDHVKYWDADREVFNYHFLGKATLDALVDLGIPEVPRKSKVYESEVEAHKDYCWTIIEEEQEVEALIANMDAEIDDLLG